MELLRAKAEVNSSTKLPATEETQFVGLRSLDPRIKTITIEFYDTRLARKFWDRKQVEIIAKDDEQGDDQR